MEVKGTGEMCRWLSRQEMFWLQRKAEGERRRGGWGNYLGDAIGRTGLSPECWGGGGAGGLKGPPDFSFGSWRCPEELCMRNAGEEGVGLMLRHSSTDLLKVRPP